LSHLALLGEFAAHKVALIVPVQGINTSSSNPASALLLNMLGAIAQFEHSIIVERVKAGLAAARRRGVKLGRPGTLDFHRRPCLPRRRGARLPRNWDPVIVGLPTHAGLEDLRRLAPKKCSARPECRPCPCSDTHLLPRAVKNDRTIISAKS
jgi:hypothetical protein